MRHEERRAEIASTGVRLQAEGLLSGTAGNLSCRTATDRIVITPSGIPYAELRPQDVVVTDLDGHVVDGERTPSSELPFHLAVYRARPDVGAVVHTHSPYATVLAIMHKPIPAIHYALASLGVCEVPVVPYSTFGSAKLAADVGSAFAAGGDGVLLANHGAIAVARELQAAATNAGILEFLACSYYRTLAAGGGVVVLQPDEIAQVVQAYKSYGQPASLES
jgi:L-fuculose-phosphate aldolase